LQSKARSKNAVMQQFTQTVVVTKYRLLN